MKNTHLFFYVIPFFLGFHMTLWSQIKMGDRPLVIDPHAIFEIASTQQGILLPRMSTLERDTAFRENLHNVLRLFHTDNDQLEVYLTKNQKWEPIKTTLPKFVLED